MAVTVVSKKTKLQEKPVVKKATKELKGNMALQVMSEVADELATMKLDIDAKAKTLKLLEDKYKKKLAPILEMIDDDYKADDAVTGEGDVYAMVVSEKAKKTNIKDVAKAYNFMKKAGGVALLLKTLKFNLTDLREYLTPTEIAEVLEDEKTGARKVTFVKK